MDNVLLATQKTIPLAQKKAVFIVLSYNGCDDTIECLESLYSCNGGAADVIVVDNNSTPSVESILTGRFPDIDLVSLNQNLGWAGGNNVGIEIAVKRGYEWICLLNNDTVFPEGQVKAWVDTLTKLPAALVQPSIYYWDDPEVPQLLEGYDKAGIKLPNAKEWHGKILMDYAYGACLAIHRDIFQKVGFFDERLFLQLEETDFYRRAVRAGYVSVCASEVKMFHKESKAFGGRTTPGKTYYTIRNSLLLLEKHRGTISEKFRLLQGLYWAISNTAARENNEKTTVGIFRWLLSDSPYAIASRHGISDYIKRRFGQMPSSLARRIVGSIPVISS